MKSDKYPSIPEYRYRKARFIVSSLKVAHWRGLSSNSNIVGAAYGRRTAHNEITDEPALVIYVMRKVPQRFVPPSLLLPRRAYIGHDYVEVDVVETGPIYPLAFTARERPAPAGVSIGNANEASAGTLGSVVIDNTDNSTCIVSNNHVMARQNAAAIGEDIVQQGVYDGGAAPADTIADLKRFVTINAMGNTVDGAIAQATNAAGGGLNVIDQVKNNIIPVAGPDHRAVGLLFAGSCNRTIMNPIADVLTQLNISFPAGAGSTTAAEIGMNVEKVGRTTEYTTSTVKEIDATVNIPYNFGNATFDNQFTTAWMSDSGDSGSVVYEGGAGGDEDKCGCGTSSAAATLLGAEVKQDRCMAEQVRDKFLRQTRIGRWAVDVFYRNEDRLLERFEATKIDEGDRNYARKVYGKYIDLARRTFIDGADSKQKLTTEHLREMNTALKRAHQYADDDEYLALNELYKLANEHAQGKTVGEILALLNDEKLFEKVRQIASRVKFLRIGKSKFDQDKYVAE